MRERRVPRVLARLHDHPTESLEAHTRDGLDRVAHERNQSHRRLHRVFILGTVRHREDVEQVLEHLLRVRLDITRGVPERGPGARG